jgi:hypothetical protein
LTKDYSGIREGHDLGNSDFGREEGLGGKVNEFGEEHGTAELQTWDRVAVDWSDFCFGSDEIHFGLHVIPRPEVDARGKGDVGSVAKSDDVVSGGGG